MTADRLSLQDIWAAYTFLVEYYAQQTRIQSDRFRYLSVDTFLTHPPFLSPQLPIPWDIRLYDQVASTNQTLWQLLQEQEPQQLSQSPIVAIAHEQTQGKGQRSRKWLSPLGGLYLSVAQHLDCPVRNHALLSIATAWGIASVLDVMEVPIGLKWPNDLVVEGKKLGGILIETRMRGDRLTRAVIGVGINWANPIPDTGISLRSCLPESSPVQTLNDVAALVLLGIQVGITNWQRQGGKAIATAYEQFWVNHGQRITLPVPHGHSLPTSSGEIVGVNANGHLIIQRPFSSGSGFLTEAYAPGTIQVGYGVSGN